MNNLVVYDSGFGNTEKIAREIAKSISAKVVRVTELGDYSDIKDIKLLVVGSPTLGGRPTVDMQNFLSDIPENFLKGVKIAAFDTRFSEKDSNFLLRMVIQKFGYAAPKMEEVLIERGGTAIVSCEGFIVSGKEGPLASGELERSGNWIKSKI